MILEILATFRQTAHMVPRLIASQDLKKRVGEFEKVLVEFEIKNPHPDLLYFPADYKLGIEQSKAIKEHLLYKPMQAKGKLVILEDASNLTPEAQNALLKILEETPPSSLIVLGVKSESDLLPTIISRCQISYLAEDNTRVVMTPEMFQDIHKLLQSDIEDRFNYIEKLKDKEEFLHSLVAYFRHDLASHLLSGNSKFLAELLQAEEWARQNVNIRAILEYLMLVMPNKS